MEKSVLLVVLIVGVFVFGEFKHAIAERSGGKYHLPQRGKPHSPSYAPMHSPKSQSPHHPPYSSLSMVPGPSVLPSIHHSSAPSIRTFTSTSPRPSFFKPATTLQQTKPLKSTRHEIQHHKVLIIVAIALVLLILGAIIILFTYWTCTWVSRSRLCPVLPSSQPQTLRKQSDIDDSGWVLIHGTAFRLG